MDVLKLFFMSLFASSIIVIMAHTIFSNGSNIRPVDFEALDEISWTISYESQESVSPTDESVTVTAATVNIAKVPGEQISADIPNDIKEMIIGPQIQNPTKYAEDRTKAPLLKINSSIINKLFHKMAIPVVNTVKDNIGKTESSNGESIQSNLKKDLDKEKSKKAIGSNIAANVRKTNVDNTILDSINDIDEGLDANTNTVIGINSAYARTLSKEMMVLAALCFIIAGIIKFYLF